MSEAKMRVQASELAAIVAAVDDDGERFTFDRIQDGYRDENGHPDKVPRAVFVDREGEPVGVPLLLVVEPLLDLVGRLARDLAEAREREALALSIKVQWTDDGDNAANVTPKQGVLMPAIMDAPDGPRCGCGAPSRYESGWCGGCGPQAGCEPSASVLKEPAPRAGSIRAAIDAKDGALLRMASAETRAFLDAMKAPDGTDETRLDALKTVLRHYASERGKVVLARGAHPPPEPDIEPAIGDEPPA